MTAAVRQVNPTRRERRSRAPYNFVPLPAAVYTSLLAELPPHDRDDLARLSGWFELAITTEMPAFVPAALPADGDVGAAEHFAHQGDPARPALPGSALRGMTRALVELLGHGRLAPAQDRRLFFRALEDGVLAERYRARFAGAGEGRAEAGLFRRAGGGMIEPQAVARISHALIEQELGERPYRGGTPTRKINGHRVYVRLATGEGESATAEVEHIRLAPRGERPGEGEREGRLVITGPAPHRGEAGEKREYVFLRGEGDERSRSVRVPAVLVAAVESPDQVTPWQADAYPPDGRLIDGAPVFFVRGDDGQAAAFGRAEAFRVPYRQATVALAGAAATTPAGAVDLAEAIFGVAGAGGRRVKGRVFFEDAPWDGEGDDPFLGGPDEGRRTPRPLATPRPEAFQHYLVQPDPDDPAALADYDAEPDETALRGTKRYWHRPDAERRDLFEDGPRREGQRPIRPVRPGVTFRGRVRFENLSALELGSLLAALRLPAEGRHQIGMGKALGMGSIRVAATARLLDPARRYRRLFAGDGGLAAGLRDEAATEAALTEAAEAFRAAMVGHHNATDAPAVAEDADLWQIPRLAALRLLLAWEGAPPARATRAIGLNEPAPATAGERPGPWWRARPVLPTPHGVLGLPDPFFPNAEPFQDAPPAAPAGVAEGAPRPPRRERPERRPDGRGGRPGRPREEGRPPADGRPRDERPREEPREREPELPPYAGALARLMEIGRTSEPAATPAPPADPNLWPAAQLRMQNRQLIAQAGGRTARSVFGTTADLLAALPDELRRSLERGRTVEARVRIEPGARGNEIVEIGAGDGPGA